MNAFSLHDVWFAPFAVENKCILEQAVAVMQLLHATFMKTPILFSFLIIAMYGRSQSVALFKDFTFDSTYSLIALGSAFSNTEKAPEEFSFTVSDVSELADIQRQWIVTIKRPRNSVERYSIDLHLLKNGYLVSSRWMIYPEQGIVHYGDSWYDFDMKKFKAVQKRHTLRYHSQRFVFDTMLDFALFRDSIQSTPNFLFLFEPTANAYAGYFNVILPRSGGSNDDIFAMHDLNKELKAQFPNEKFNVTTVVNDPSNLANKHKLSIKVECTMAFYEKYRSEAKETEAWTPYKPDARVIFKD